MEIFYVVFTLFVPIVMIVCGYILKKHHSETPNGLMGYRTRRSMKNNDTWKFANELAGALLIKYGFIATVIFALFSIVYFQISINAGLLIMTVTVVIQSVLMIATIYPVENALRVNFDKDGNRKRKDKINE